MLDIQKAKKLAEKYKKIYGRKISLSGEIFGISPPNVFISSSYPKTNLGVLVSDEKIIDNPIHWVNENLSLIDVLRLRLSMINLFKSVPIDLPRKNSKFYEEILLGGLSIKDVDYEAKIRKIRAIDLKRKIPPSFFGASIEKIKLDSNPKIPRVVEVLLEENMKAEDEVIMLYEHGFDDYYLQRLLSLGVLGLKPDRKLVPSKWAITAIHSIIIKYLEKKLRDFNIIEKFYFMYGGLYGNYFYILMFPEFFDFEYFEIFLPGCAYNNGNKVIYGRDEESGGYFATKLSIYEILRKIKRKAGILALRIVNHEYKIPMGVWVVREASKKVINNVLKFDSKEELIKYAYETIRKKHKFNLHSILKVSRLWKKINNKRLTYFFNLNCQNLSPK